MNLSNHLYNHGPSDFSDRAAFCDSHSNISHSNISISAVISSSCVVLEGLRDNTSDCLSAVFPLGQDGQSFFTSEFHTSTPSSLRGENLAMLPNVHNKLDVHNSLDSPPTGLGYENHFFESAASEFTTVGNEMTVTSNTSRADVQFSTENGTAVDVPVRPYFGGHEDGTDNDGCAMNIFTHSNKLLNKDSYLFSSPGRDIDNDYSRNCRSNTTCSIFYPSSQDKEHILESPYECALLSKNGSASLRDNAISFMPIVDTEDQGMDRNLRSWRNDNCFQPRTLSPCQDMSFSGHRDTVGDTLNTHYNFIALQKRVNLPAHNILDSGSPTFSTQSEFVVSYTKNSSFQPYSLTHCDYEISDVSEAVGGRSLCSSLSDSASMHGNSFRHICPQLPCAEVNRNDRTELKEVRNSTVENSNDTMQSMRVKYSNGKGSKSTCKRHFINKNSNIAYGQENYNCISSPNSLSHNDTLKNVNSMEAGNTDIPVSVASNGKAKRKHAETVEGLQHHLEMLEDKRTKTGPSCSSLNLLRQRSQADGEKLTDDSGALIVDVDHMMCSGVTVAGFKPRAIIRKRIKTAIPTDIKDTEYWQKRRKNNDSARKSRESKKEKEKNFYKRALELEYENLYLQECLSLAEAELASLGHPFVPPVFGGQCYY